MPDRSIIAGFLDTIVAMRGLGWSFTERVARGASERDVAAAIMDAGFAMFGGEMLGFYLLGTTGAAEIHTRGVSTAFVDEYESYGRSGDPFLASILTVATPLAGPTSVVGPRGDRGYAEFVRSHGYVSQYMLLPIVINGRVMGTVNVARTHDRRFSFHDLRTAMMVSLHVSARLSVLRVF